MKALAIWLTFVAVEAVGRQSNSRDIYLLGLIPMGGDVWPAGQTVLLGINMALEEVNSRVDILDGYSLKLLWGDTKVGCFKFTQVFVVLLQQYYHIMKEGTLLKQTWSCSLVNNK